MNDRESQTDPLRRILTTMTLGDVDEDVCIYEDGRVIYACYDAGRTHVLAPTSHRSRGIVEILKDALPPDRKSDAP